MAISGSVVAEFKDCVAGAVISCTFAFIFTFVISFLFFFVPLYLLLIIYNFLDRKSEQIKRDDLKSREESKASKASESSTAPVERIFIAPPASPTPEPEPAPVATPAPTPAPVASTTKGRSTAQFRQMLKDYLAD